MRRCVLGRASVNIGVSAAEVAPSVVAVVH